MSSIQLIRIFLSSPGDVAEERKYAIDLIKDVLPYRPAFRDKVTCEVVAWDDPAAQIPMVANETPQESVNRTRPRPATCDITVVILWSRMGTPLPGSILKANGEPYMSGTEWEYLDAVTSPLKPTVLIYRRTEEREPGLRDPNQTRNLEYFFAQFRNPDGSIAGGINEYASPADFNNLLRQHLEEIVFQKLQIIRPEVPHEIPVPVADFINRTEDMSELQRAVAGKGTIAGIFGAPGIGKTELARRLASELAPHYADGQIYVDLKGSSASPISSRDLLTDLIRKFGSSAPGALSVDELGKRYRSIMYGKRVLLFLDNAAGLEQVKQMEPPQGCLLLITGLSRFYIPGMISRELELFGKHDSMEFLLRIEPRIGKQAAAIAKLCGYLPFALRNAAGTLNMRRDKEPGEYVRDLSASRKARSNLIESVIGVSFDMLTPPETKERWCGLSCFAEPFPREAIEAIWGLTADESEPVIGVLMTSALLHYDERLRRYYMHDLDRAFAQVHLVQTQEYLHRHAAYFLRQLTPERRHPLELLDSLANEVFAAFEFCGQERNRRGSGSAIGVIREVLKSDELAAADAAYLIARLFKRKHKLPEALELYETCRRVAVSAGKASLEGACLRSIGEIYWIQDNPSGAKEYGEKAITRLSSEEDYDSRKELIFTLHLYSEQCVKNGLFDDAERAALDSLDIRDRIRPEERETRAGLSNGAIKSIAFLLQRNDLEGAFMLLALERNHLDGIDRASTLGQVGCALSDAHRFADAKGLFQDALIAYEAIPNDVGSSWIHRCRGELALRSGDIVEARAEHERALRICEAGNFQPYQRAVALIAAIRFYRLAGELETVGELVPRLEKLREQINESDSFSKWKVIHAMRDLDITRADRERLEASIDVKLEPASEVEALADRWGCDALSLAWPGQLFRNHSLTVAVR